jgi:hypothetical protein
MGLTGRLMKVTPLMSMGYIYDLSGLLYRHEKEVFGVSIHSSRR